MTSSSSTADCVILTLASLSWVVALLSYKFPQVWLAMNRSKSPTRTSSTSARSICWGKQPISPSGLEAIANHKYRSAGYTPLDLLMDKFWTWIAQFVPASVAPNAITFTGLLMVTPAFFTVVYYGSAIETERPRWIGLLAAATMFVYQTLDAVDGKHARRVGASSPLGQLFDHGIDGFTTLYVAYPLVSGLGFTTMQFFFMLSVVQGSFLGAQWVERHTHVLSTNIGFAGVTEGQMFSLISAAISAFLPYAWFRTPFNIPVSITSKILALTPAAWTSCVSTTLSHVTVNSLIVFFIVTSNMILIAHNFATIIAKFKSTPKKMMCAFAELIPLAALIVLHYTWLQLPSSRIYPALTQLTIGFAFSHICNQIIVTAMSGDKFSVRQPVLIPLLLLVVNGLAPLFFPYITGGYELNEAILVWIVFLTVASTQLCWVYRVCQQIAQRLDIYVFRLGRPSLEGASKP